jgi:peptide methionine sulfoxide reductase MsrA
VDIQTVVSFAVIAGGCTWALARALGKIESAFSAHVAEDKATHESQGARILKLESNKRPRR